MKNKFFTVYIEQDEDGIYIGSIPAVNSCYAEGKTQEKMFENLQEVLKLCLRNSKIKKKDLEKTKFIGIQNLKMEYA
ncbi:MAG: type II toxin-antitoxin system HicB family antitoxin [Candidatus Pacebacteria bacterium]|nr:type II toxin-antitoxin system HicB family antitoxin [Candidatus Paceibacterota bacterium]